ncbi:DUF3679 domain-containing protein [Bacillus cytotoxicus]|uniref:DUF3679 domain-containing protein n=1 Tax=Bacillus cytotoxicus TaxID=580165 RepID=UPI003D7DD55E
MSRFSLQCVCGVIFCLFIMLAGIGMANYGLKSMKGYRQPTYEQIAHMTGTKQGNMETEILSETFSANEKQKQLEKIRSFNIVEGVGMKIAELIRNIVKFGLDITIGKIRGIFNALGAF